MLGVIVDNGSDSGLIWTIVGVLAIIALLLFIVRR